MVYLSCLHAPCQEVVFPDPLFCSSKFAPWCPVCRRVPRYRRPTRYRPYYWEPHSIWTFLCHHSQCSCSLSCWSCISPQGIVKNHQRWGKLGVVPCSCRHIVSENMFKGLSSPCTGMYLVDIAIARSIVAFSVVTKMLRALAWHFDASCACPDEALCKCFQSCR